MPKTYFVVPALLLAGCAASQSAGRPDVTDSRAKVPVVEFRTAFDGYRPFAEEEQKDWRKANDEVGAAGGHAGKPQPGKPEASGGHGGHK